MTKRNEEIGMEIQESSENVFCDNISKIIFLLSIIKMMSRKFNLLSLPTSIVNCNFVCKELKIVRVSLMYSDGNARTMSSTYL